jgi:hypothetical protein
MAMIDGMPSAPCAKAEYGYASYGRIDRPMHLPDLTPAELCRRAGAMQFDRVLVATAAGDGRIVPHQLRCARGAPVPP